MKLHGEGGGLPRLLKDHLHGNAGNAFKRGGALFCGGDK